MTQQGSARQSRGLSSAAKWIGIALAAIVSIVLVWKAVSWGYHRTVGYNLIGKWGAEQISLFGVNLPIGANLEFTPTSAQVLGTVVPVSEYQREGNVVRVIVTGTAGLQANFTFRFEDPDRIAFDGPYGVTFRYRRTQVAK